MLVIVGCTGGSTGSGSDFPVVSSIPPSISKLSSILVCFSFWIGIDDIAGAA